MTAKIEESCRFIESLPVADGSGQRINTDSELASMRGIRQQADVATQRERFAAPMLP
jgi:hypothetical protein